MKHVIIFTDPHFGCRNNSIIWFNSQKAFMEEQFIPYVRTAHPDMLMCLGDVFDIRSTVSVYIGECTRKIFKTLASLVPDFTIIGGNHDFYSPTSDQYNSISMIFRGIPNLNIFASKIGGNEAGRMLYLPWYEWLKFYENKITESKAEHYRSEIKEGRIKNIFTHADIWREQIPLFEGANIFSGHIHTPRCEKNLFNLGSCFALTFADSNQERGFYDVTFEDDGTIREFKFIKNEKSIRFWRFYDDEIFDKLDNTDIHQDDYIELYVSKKNLLKSEFSSRINDLSIHHKSLWCIPIINDQEKVSEITDVKISNFDMKSMIESYIPDELREKFNRVLELAPKTDQTLH